MEDIGLALADFVSNMENVPSEIRHLFMEITDLDEKYEEAMSRAHKDERSLQRTLKEGKREQASEQEERLLGSIDERHSEAKALCQEKLRLTRKAMTIVQRHLSKLDAEIRHYDKKSGDGGRQLRAGYTPLDTVGIQDGELAFGLPTPKRFSDSVPLSLENALSEADAFYTPTRAPKRPRNNPSQPRTVQRKKHLKLANSILSLDGIEMDAAPASASGGGIEESDDQPYCFCRQVSYGNMVACDGPECRYEWFHWECVGLTSSPKGAWYCSECLDRMVEDED